MPKRGPNVSFALKNRRFLGEVQNFSDSGKAASGSPLARLLQYFLPRVLTSEALPRRARNLKSSILNEKKRSFFSPPPEISSGNFVIFRRKITRERAGANPRPARARSVTTLASEKTLFFSFKIEDLNASRRKSERGPEGGKYDADG